MSVEVNRVADLSEPDAEGTVFTVFDLDPFGVRLVCGIPERVGDRIEVRFVKTVAGLAVQSQGSQRGPNVRHDHGRALRVGRSEVGRDPVGALPIGKRAENRV